MHQKDHVKYHNAHALLVSVRRLVEQKKEDELRTEADRQVRNVKENKLRSTSPASAERKDNINTKNGYNEVNSDLKNCKYMYICLLF